MQKLVSKEELRGRIVNLSAWGDRLVNVDPPAETGDTWPLVKGEGGDKLYLLGAIVSETERLLFEDVYPNDVSGSQITKLLNDYEGSALELVINCPGGSVYEGAVVYEALNALKDNGVKVTAFISGVAASAASYVMMAADNIEIGQMGQIFIHPPQAFLFGGAGSLQLRELANALDKIEVQLLDLYKSRRGLDLRDALHATADVGEGTYYTAKEAVENGLVDSIRQPKKKESAGSDNMNAASAELSFISADNENSDSVAANSIEEPNGFNITSACKKRFDDEAMMGLWRRP